MSYILDALKKSEEQRNQGAVSVPGYQAQPAPTKKNKMDIISILGMVILFIAFFLYLFIQKISGPEIIEATSTTIEISKNNSSTPTLDQGHFDTNSERLSVIKSIQEKPDSLSTKTYTEPFDDAFGNLNKANKPSVKEDQDLIARAGQEAPEKLIAELENIRNLNEIDAMFQKQVPDLDYSSHWHDSNPEKSNIIINNQSLREGAWINSKIQIEKILIDETIFKMDKQRFKLNSLQNWPG